MSIYEILGTAKCSCANLKAQLSETSDEIERLENIVMSFPKNTFLPKIAEEVDSMRKSVIGIVNRFVDSYIIVLNELKEEVNRND
jgi:hypothetical protein